jgi:hypothetical protein
MALQASIEIAGFDSLIRQRREEYFAAVRSGLGRNYRPMRNLFARAVKALTG